MYIFYHCLNCEAEWENLEWREIEGHPDECPYCHNEDCIEATDQDGGER